MLSVACYCCVSSQASHRAVGPDGSLLGCRDSPGVQPSGQRDAKAAKQELDSSVHRQVQRPWDETHEAIPLASASVSGESVEAVTVLPGWTGAVRSLFRLECATAESLPGYFVPQPRQYSTGVREGLVCQDVLGLFERHACFEL